jgi:hypothetical protein
MTLSRVVRFSPEPVGRLTRLLALAKARACPTAVRNIQARLAIIQKHLAGRAAVRVVSGSGRIA